MTHVDKKMLLTALEGNEKKNTPKTDERANAHMYVSVAIFHIIQVHSETHPPILKYESLPH